MESDRDKVIVKFDRLLLATITEGLYRFFSFVEAQQCRELLIQQTAKERVTSTHECIPIRKCDVPLQHLVIRIVIHLSRFPARIAGSLRCSAVPGLRIVLLELQIVLLQMFLLFLQQHASSRRSDTSHSMCQSLCERWP